MDTQISNGPEYMSPALAAKYIDTTPSTLNDWRWKGTGPRFFKMGRKHIRYRRRDLDAFMEGRG